MQSIHHDRRTARRINPIISDTRFDTLHNAAQLVTDVGFIISLNTADIPLGSLYLLCGAIASAIEFEASISEGEAA